MTPLEANVFGKPVAAPEWGGHVDTVREGLTGCFFSEPEPDQIRETIRTVAATEWSATAIQDHAAHFEERAFQARLRHIASEERSLL